MHPRALALVVACSMIAGASSTVLADRGAKPAAMKPPAKPPKAPTSPTSSSPATKTTKAAKPDTKPAPFVARIKANPVLAARIQALLPPNTTLDAAAMGFRNEGQFIAALHAARNLNISFADLKAKMTGDPRESLGRAIQDLKPGVDSKQAAKLAEFEEKVDIEESKENASDNHDTVTLKNGPFVRHIQNNAALLARVTPLLPSGMTLAQAASGFHNEREFLAALHASQNLGIPFAQIKAEMTGKDHDKLAVAIFEQKSSVDALAEAKKAQDQARADIEATEGNGR